MNDTNLEVALITIEVENDGQRIDNFLITRLKGVPKSRIYRILRKGEVRVNKKRIKPEYRLVTGDLLRIPPIRVSAKDESSQPSAKLDWVQMLLQCVLYEDDHLLVLNKPSGMAVHGGSGVNAGVIEGLRSLRPESRFLELVHRLDRDTSGCLLVAKKRSALRGLHQQLRDKQVSKQYWALVRGQWQADKKQVIAPLRKNVLKSGERIVRVSADGKPSETRFKILQKFEEATLVEASPVTGRTHQIRVHTQCQGHPIAGDNKYGDADFEQRMKDKGLSRLFLHAKRLVFTHPNTQERLEIEAPLDPLLQRFLQRLTPHPPSKR